MLTKKTAIAIANCHAQIQNAEDLLKQMQDIIKKHPYEEPEYVRDVFGQRRNSLHLGIPNGDSSSRMLNVDFELAAIIIEAQIGKYKIHLQALNNLAATECQQTEAPNVQVSDTTDDAKRD